MIAQIPIDASLATKMTHNSIRVHTQASIIDLTITHIITIITTLGKATPTEPATVVEPRGTLQNTAPNRTFGASGVTLPPTIQWRADPKPRSSTPMESPKAGSYHPTQSPNQHNTSNQPPAPIHTTQPSPAPSGQ